MRRPKRKHSYGEVEQIYRGVKRIDDCARDLKTGAGLTLRVLASPGQAGHPFSAKRTSGQSAAGPLSRCSQ